VVKNDLVKSSNEIEQLKKDLADEQTTVAEKNQALIAQNEKFVALRRDLKDSVKKTRELRTELTDRVTENLKAEVKLREVETELSVAQASTDMIATGVLDYSMTPEGKEDEDEKVQAAKAGP
jgi:chromosome segregation ATPase